MSELLGTHPRSARPMRKPYVSHRDFDHDPIDPSYEWRILSQEAPKPREGHHFKMRDFCDLFDTGSDEYRPAAPKREEKCRFAHLDGGRNETIDLRRSRKDLPIAGQIIWDDIGEGMMVESLSWSQSDVEREIESWDRKLKSVEGTCHGNVAWNEGDMIRFEDGYVPRRSGSIGYRDEKWRNARKFREVHGTGSLPRYDKQERNIRTGRCEDVKKPSVVAASEILPTPMKENLRFNLSRGSDDPRHSCSHSYNSFKQVRVKLILSPNFPQHTLNRFHDIDVFCSYIY